MPNLLRPLPQFLVLEMRVVRERDPRAELDPSQELHRSGEGGRLGDVGVDPLHQVHGVGVVKLSELKTFENKSTHRKKENQPEVFKLLVDLRLLRRVQGGDGKDEDDVAHEVDQEVLAAAAPAAQLGHQEVPQVGVGEARAGHHADVRAPEALHAKGGHGQHGKHQRLG